MNLLPLSTFRRFWSPALMRPAAEDCRLVEVIRATSKPFAQQTTEQLQDQARELRRTVRSAKWNEAGQHLTTAFALTSEAVRRVTGKTYYDVQLLGGLALARGEIAQMQTGEGKTLTTALPAFFFSLAGRGVHVATTNAYLAERDSEELRPALECLGVSVGLLPSEHDATVKRRAYRCDITFGTGYEFGFDFLRDQIAIRQQPKLKLGVQHLMRLTGERVGLPESLQRPHAFAVIDEADSVLIDEATMPLILSGIAADQGDAELYELARRTADGLRETEHYVLDEATQSIQMTEAGWAALHQPLHNPTSYGLRRRWASYIEGALRAKYFLQRDVDYVVLDGKVQIVDQHTGRIHEERSWRDGLHQAVEVREGTPVSPEKTVDGTVSRQHYFQLYDHVCGMTGTASGNEHEFREFYGLKVCEIPTHRPCRRQRLASRFFTDEATRDAALTSEVRTRHATGQPVLVGSRTIRHSRRLSEMLTQQGVPHAVLNGVQDEEEARIVSRAGMHGAVTIATNMAGRGTDIRLDEQALACGGLHVIATEHNESQRVDRQLAGRAARQGNPGSVRFYVSADDELFTVVRSRLPQVIRQAADSEGEAHVNLADDVAAVQDQLEQMNYQRRREMVRRDHWMESILDTLARQA